MSSVMDTTTIDALIGEDPLIAILAADVIAENYVGDSTVINSCNKLAEKYEVTPAKVRSVLRLHITPEVLETINTAAARWIKRRD